MDYFVTSAGCDHQLLTPSFLHRRLLHDLLDLAAKRLECRAVPVEHITLLSCEVLDAEALHFCVSVAFALLSLLGEEPRQLDGTATLLLGSLAPLRVLLREALDFLLALISGKLRLEHSVLSLLNHLSHLARGNHQLRTLARCIDLPLPESCVLTSQCLNVTLRLLQSQLDRLPSLALQRDPMLALLRHSPHRRL